MAATCSPKKTQNWNRWRKSCGLLMLHSQHLLCPSTSPRFRHQLQHKLTALVVWQLTTCTLFRCKMFSMSGCPELQRNGLMRVWMENVRVAVVCFCSDKTKLSVAESKLKSNVHAIWEREREREGESESPCHRGIGQSSKHLIWERDYLVHNY